jgi:hypothetical protein
MMRRLGVIAPITSNILLDLGLVSSASASSATPERHVHRKKETDYWLVIQSC